MDKVGKYLFDIQAAISLIESFIQDVDSFEAYKSDIENSKCC